MTTVVSNQNSTPKATPGSLTDSFVEAGIYLRNRNPTTVPPVSPRVSG